MLNSLEFLDEKAMNGRRVASIDIGSNAMRLLIAEECDGRIKSVETDRASVRLGAEVFDKGMLSEQDRKSTRLNSSHG